MFRVAAIAMLALLIIFKTPTAVQAGEVTGGLHIFVMKNAGPASIHVDEYIDNAIIQASLQNSAVETDIFYALDPSLSNLQLTSIHKAESIPLIVFLSENADRMENLIVDKSRIRSEAELKSVFNSQVARGLFQVPMWPYLAATEVPFQLMDIQEANLIPHELGMHFPHVNFTQTEHVNKYEVVENSNGEFTLVDTGEGGEGMGIVFRYSWNVDPLELQIPVMPWDSIVLIYSDSNLIWRPPVSSSGEVNFNEFMQSYTDNYTGNLDTTLYTYDLISSDDSSIVSRTLIRPNADLAPFNAGASVYTPSEVITDPPGGFNLFTAIIILWLSFSIILLILNIMFRYSHLEWHEIIVRGIAIYPFYLAFSLLLSGLFGLGFIPAAVALTAFISPRGKRIAGSLAILGSSFAITFITFLFKF